MANTASNEGIGKAIAPLLLLGSMLAVALLYLNAQYPNLVSEIKYKLGGSTSAPSTSSAVTQESVHQEKINALLISPRNKIDLREGRPFWGAATHMVELAFRSPADDASILRHNQRIYEFHRYGFSGNREAVVMEFSDNVLTCVHYPQREKTACSPGTKSIYAGQPFPFSYKVTVGR